MGTEIEMQNEIDGLKDDVREFNRGWTDRQNNKPFEESETDIWQQGWMVFDYDSLKEKYEDLLKKYMKACFDKANKE